MEQEEVGNDPELSDSESDVDPDASSTDRDDDEESEEYEVKDHLVVLIHGIHGTKADLEFMATALSNKSESLLVHCSTANDGIFSTHNGIDAGGQRISKEIQELVKDYPNIKKISIIGHSLGGLYARYCIGQLYSDNFMKNVQPLNFVTLASPHVGSRRPPRGLFNTALNVFTPKFFSITGKQLMLEDDNRDVPLLLEMSQLDSSFYKGLELFQSRTLYSNIVNDIQVPYCTSAITAKNPYSICKKTDFTFATHYPHIVENVTLKGFINSGQQYLQDHTTAYLNDRKKEHLQLILQNLQNLSWKRVDVWFDDVLSHEKIVAKRRWVPGNGIDIVDHLVQNFVI